MLSRALSLATVMLLIGCFAADPALAQATNLEAGKSPSQIFAGTCTACHKSPRGLLKTVPAGSLQSFLRQHYTTSPDMASLLTAFLVSNGANDTRYVGNQAKGKDEKPEAKPGAAPEQLDRFGRKLRPGSSQEAARPDTGKPEAEPREAAKPDADGLAEPARQGRNAKREAPAADGQAANERGPDGRRLSAKQKLSKRGKPGSEEPPKADSAKTEPGKPEPGKDETAKGEAAKEAAAKVETGKTEPDSAKTEVPKQTGNGDTAALRPDPVPPVTPAPPASSTVPAAAASAAPESSATPSAPPPAVTASAPPPVAPAGPPAPPISQ